MNSHIMFKKESLRDVSCRASMASRSVFVCRGLRQWVVLFCLLSATCVWAQSSYNMSYSQFGIGESSSPFNMPLANAMGGAIYTCQGNNFINPFNPASYAGVEEESFVFDMALLVQAHEMRTREQSLHDFDGSLAYLTFAFPICKWWKFSLGLMPYSDMSYESVQTNTFPVEGSVKTVYDGNGGINRVYFGSAFHVGSHLSLGFNVNYLYGSIQRAVTYDFIGSDVSFFVDSRKQKNTRLGAFTFDFGAQYKCQIDERRALGFGLTFQLPQTLSVKDTSWIYTLSEGSNEANAVIFPTSDDSVYESTMKQPMKIGFGISYEYDNRWLLAVDFTYAQWNGLKYAEGLSKPIFRDDESIDYCGNYRLSIGGGWLGDKGASNYWRRIGVTGGVYYDRGSLGLLLPTGNYKLDEYGVGVGCTFPMRKGRSRLQVSLSYSSFGDINLLRSNYFVVGISFGSCESWFVKRKYN